MLTALVDIGLGVLVVLLITAFTAYFVAQEFAYTAVNRSRLTAAHRRVTRQLSARWR